MSQRPNRFRLPRDDPCERMRWCVMSGTSSRRDEIHAWITEFLWEFFDSGMSNSEAADIILATLETAFPISEKTESIPFANPRELLSKWKNRQDQT